MPVVVTGASYVCTMGTSPGTLMVTSQTMTLAENKPIATVQDSVAMSNITPCGMCNSMANPQVAAATAAALGVLTPMPCIPSPVGIWLGGASVLIGGKPALKPDSTLLCAFGGSISIVSPGQGSVLC
ncbi:MAG: DUF4280 domain-containing protein [Oscillospiraceae bacterium]|nr:DUF4280 domain-containing protein [Oscillospiraceae bacterium]